MDSMWNFDLKDSLQGETVANLLFRKRWWRRQQQECLKKFNQQNTGFFRALYAMAHFFGVLCKTSTWNDKIGDLLENVNIWQLIFVSFSKLYTHHYEFSFWILRSRYTTYIICEWIIANLFRERESNFKLRFCCCCARRSLRFLFLCLNLWIGQFHYTVILLQLPESLVFFLFVLSCLLELLLLLPSGI